MNFGVIGLGFGDEGKGLVTDYLCFRNLNPLVTRYSGGQQAGHTVVLGNKRHVFSNFGSGSLRGVPTYWSEYCSVDPVGIEKEYHALKQLGVIPELFINENASITTPYEKAFNQNNLSDLQNGTCGVGVGKTFEREEDFFSLKYVDLFYPRILQIKLENISKHYYKVGRSMQTEIDKFMDSVQFIISNFACVKKIPTNYDNHIFEGSQGLLLDQNIGFFPNVTRSSVGTRNIDLILRGKPFEVWLVTRAYQTRHGNGPMTGIRFTDKDPLKHNLNETNVTNDFQGDFRVAMLDLDSIKYVIQKDPLLSSSNRVERNLVITCLDQLKYLCYTSNGVKRSFSDEDSFIQSIMHELNLFSIYVNNSPESKTMKKIERRW